MRFVGNNVNVLLHLCAKSFCTIIFEGLTIVGKEVFSKVLKSLKITLRAFQNNENHRKTPCDLDN